MRGTRTLGHRDTALHRFIPAHAGNSEDSDPVAWEKAVHPRACGELPLDQHVHGSGVGSSPRMRGTHVGAARTEAPHRFIPAHAGNSPVLPLPLHLQPVHPRACGELTLRARLCGELPLPASKYGSSPRMRGTRADDRSVHPPSGTPAPVHPRACGELSSLPLRYSEGIHGERFIPAHAGNSVEPLRASDHCSTVHPRACGELRSHIVACGERWTRYGSSPRMRGTRRGRPTAQVLGRFIPAHAGNSVIRQLPHAASAGSSPRMRGTQKYAPGRRAIFGSSPRMRGTQSRHDPMGGHNRFIPAHAGNSLPGNS